MSQQELEYWLSLTAEQINAMLKECNGIDDALQILEKIGHVRAWYIYNNQS
jgi:hypothetical protein